MLHGIQVALAQAIRPVDYYVHLIIWDNPGITADDLRLLFSNMMRVLLSNIAATVTQERNLFRERQQSGTLNSTSSNTAHAQTTEAVIPAKTAKKNPKKSKLCRLGYGRRRRSH
ncbi:hypothetical protein AYI68_g2804 [Smittium mucronatum]|uniref:Uncharacterized protein n=1 Tax=Smittium mucronatum TaxID=133383 RepID=A0A1R0H1N9_9FUNG|nr:hypothetical protein AYI68_g2804 [Smittium mucronatum]